MLGIAAAELGYRVHVFAPERGPANDIASAFTEASYHQPDLLADFAAACDVVTYEFENVPVGALRLIEDRVPLRPGIRALELAQVRSDEKAFVAGLGGRTAPFAIVDHSEALVPALEKVGLPAIVKDAADGLDGKGQARIDDVSQARAGLGGGPRRGIDRRGLRDLRPRILDPAGARIDGSTALYPPPWNQHTRRHPPPFERARSDRDRGAGGGSRRRSRARWPTRSTMSACSRSNSSRPPMARCSTRWHRASTIAAMDDRGRRDLAVREPHPRDLRAAAGLDHRSPRRTSRWRTSSARTPTAGPRCSPSPARTSTSTASTISGPGGRWGM